MVLDVTETITPPNRFRAYCRTVKPKGGFFRKAEDWLRFRKTNIIAVSPEVNQRRKITTLHFRFPADSDPQKRADFIAETFRSCGDQTAIAYVPPDWTAFVDAAGLRRADDTALRRVLAGKLAVRDNPARVALVDTRMSRDLERAARFLAPVTQLFLDAGEDTLPLVHLLRKHTGAAVRTMQKKPTCDVVVFFAAPRVRVWLPQTTHVLNCTDKILDIVGGTSMQPRFRPCAALADEGIPNDSHLLGALWETGGVSLREVIVEV